jgi:hypothetical protein
MVLSVTDIKCYSISANMTLYVYYKTISTVLPYKILIFLLLSGYITLNDFYDIMRRMKSSYTKQHIDEMIAKVDADKNKKVTLDGK